MDERIRGQGVWNETRDPSSSLTGTVNRAAKESLETAYERPPAARAGSCSTSPEVDYINSTGIAVDRRGPGDGQGRGP